MNPPLAAPPEPIKDMAPLIAAQRLYVPLAVQLKVARPDRKALRTKWKVNYVDLRTYGDHIRVRRLELRLFRREVAEISGVGETTI
jgi:hypothetical protein